ncbi:MAG: nucleotidyltransferase [Sphingomonadales bacterium]|nr:nucleotidyltransferase [Sphingomonadales bacterium]NCO47691.1 nucleotidyltransferase [Sphingomonadales bacterium]NCP00228.1 nucleotidyltransferase [Sphingomonadales bacterium]NCP26856.1 nucleotidyltransferase [Sphingomonadales bacterium]NCP44546.1 nucleotidyltransferase [Sphingomonadales bacterium]
MPNKPINDHESFLEEVAKSIDITPAQHEDAVAKYTSIGEWLDRPESALDEYDPEIFPQGSFLIGTAIRPLDNREEFDIDLVCKLDAAKDDFSQKSLKTAVGAEIQSYADAHAMTNEPVEGRRCWTLVYAGGARFHMDILPAIPDEESYRVLLETAGHFAASRDVRVTGGAIAITDKEHPNYHRIADEWPSSNPVGYAAWFKEQMSGQLFERKRDFAASEQLVIASVQDVPDHKVKTSLQRAIQLLKRHRDYFYRDDPEHKPISIIISTLAAKCYGNERRIVDALSLILKNMDQHIENRNGVAWVANPVNPAENFADKWEGEVKKTQCFFDWLEAARRDFGAYLRASPFKQMPVELEDAFGSVLVKRVVASSVGPPAIVGLAATTERVDAAVRDVERRGQSTQPWADI